MKDCGHRFAGCQLDPIGAVASVTLVVLVVDEVVVDVDEVVDVLVMVVVEDVVTVGAGRIDVVVVAGTVTT